MHHWDRDISGRFQRVSTPIEQGCEVSAHSEQMDPLPEEQQSQQGALVNMTRATVGGSRINKICFLYSSNCRSQATAV